MRALFLIPGDATEQLQATAAVAAVADQLSMEVHIACAPALAPCWSLVPAVKKVIPFDFGSATLADWANLLGSVREPDFQLCINLATGRQVDLMLSMSHIPTRIARGGFSATETVPAPAGGWPNQTLETYLKPLGVSLDAVLFRPTLPKAALDQASSLLPAGDGPLLLLAPQGGAADWPAERWLGLPAQIAAKLPTLRCLQRSPATASEVRQRAALVARADVVLASDPITVELALLLGVPLVALGRGPETLPQRQGVIGLGEVAQLADLLPSQVLSALGFG